jgi:predicted ATPase
MAGLHNSLAAYSSLDMYTTCGELLKFLRRRVRLSQRELSIAVGYSESHISRIENNERSVDRTSVLALFVPALQLEEEPEMVNRFLALCAESPTTANGASAAPVLPPPLPPTAVHPQTVATACPPERRSLSVPLTAFIGRTEEVAEVSALLHRQQVRLLTLTGAGGCGKTRLARRVGELLQLAYPQGVWWVELAALSEPTLLPNVVAAALALDKAAADATLAQLTDFLHDRQVLLILDNCEHLIAGVAPLAVRLLQACPQLQILAASREALAVAGELNYGVHPLALPPAPRGAAPLAAAMAGYDAIQLFVARARTAHHNFRLTDQNAPAVVGICQRLDGIPLGIELAAAWVNLLSPEQIAARLTYDFDLLVDEKRLALPRHQTLHAAIEWSYNLLSETERQLLRWLAIFVGGWDLAALEAVVTAASQPGTLTGNQLLRHLHQLVNKSLVVVDHGAVGEALGAPRARLLEPLRDYLLAKLAQAGETQRLRDCHLSYFLTLAEAVAAAWTDAAPQVGWVPLETEQENLRAALDWTLATKQSEAGLRLASALARFWRHRGYYSEGRRWLQALLAQAPTASPARPQTLLWLGDLCPAARGYGRGATAV